MEKMKIAQVAKSIGVSLNSVYRKVKQCETELNGHISKDRGITFLTNEGVAILRSLFQKLSLGETTDNSDFARVKHLEKVISDQQRTIDSLISQHAEERARSSEERHRADTIIMRLSQDIGNLQNAIEYHPTIESNPIEEEKPTVSSTSKKVEKARGKLSDLKGLFPCGRFKSRSMK